ncbi:hypothetical protein [Desulfopila sp. IMCC35008]|nr:hypothetical protein [Desulfopila sp. IMCC35008]
MNRVLIGVLLCMTGLFLLHNQQPLLGFPLFVAGFLIMNRKNRRRK